MAKLKSLVPKTFRDVLDQPTIAVITSQRARVVDRLRQQNEVVIPWEWTHANHSTYHDRAYRWIAEQYALRIGHVMRGAPVWGFPIEREVAPRNADEVVLQLEVPRNEVLFSNHERWGWVLWGDTLLDDGGHVGSPFDDVTDEAVRSWSKIFEILPETPLTVLQCTMDRIMRDWVRSRL